MNYVLFIGYKYGYISLQNLIQTGINIKFVVIDKEHIHEKEKYYHKIETICISNKIRYTFSTQSEIINKFLNYSNIDYLLIFGYRRLIPQQIIESVKLPIACHFSYLPYYRGFAPVNWAIINGEKETGITFFQIDKEVDNGPIIKQAKVSINNTDDINQVMDKCYSAFLSCLTELVYELKNNCIIKTPQDHSKATYTCARTPEDGLINWNENTNIIYNLIRGLTYPYPGAYTEYNGKKLTILSSEIYPIGNYVGRINGRIIKIIKDKGAVVLLKDGALLIKEVQFDSNEICTADKVINSIRVKLV